MRLIDNKKLRSQDKRKLLKETRDKGYSSVESERIRNEYLQKRGKKAKGPRGIFLEAIEKEDMTVEQAIKNTLEQMNGLLKKHLIYWMNEELNKDNLSEQAKKKIQDYLGGLGQESPRESDDDAR